MAVQAPASNATFLLFYALKAQPFSLTGIEEFLALPDLAAFHMQRASTTWHSFRLANASELWRSGVCCTAGRPHHTSGDIDGNRTMVLINSKDIFTRVPHAPEDARTVSDATSAVGVLQCQTFCNSLFLTA